MADVEKSVDPAVGVVYDDVYIGQSSGSLLKAIDIERVEVLRGPQGTLFGRNATGGVINIARSRPTQELSGKARLTYGRFDTLKAEGVVSARHSRRQRGRQGERRRTSAAMATSTTVRYDQHGQRSKF